MRARWRIFFIPALLIPALILAFARGETWQYLALPALFCCWLGDGLRLGLPGLATVVRQPRRCARAAFSTADLCFGAAFARAMETMPARHLRTPGVLYGAELVPWLTPIFLFCALLVWLWWVFRRPISGVEKALALFTLLTRFTLCAMACCAAFVGDGLRPASALGGLLLALSASLETVRDAADDTEEGGGEGLAWAAYMPGMALLTLGVSLLY